MLQRTIHKLLLRRHFWRYATFSEVSQLYTSRMLRIFALHMVSMFVAVYLYNNGFSLLFIASYMAIYYGLKAIICSPVALMLTAWIGPKHSIFAANLLYIPAIVALSFVPELGVLAVVIFSVFQGFSSTLYDFGYLVNFSKVKHVVHAGKEIGFMQIFEKTANILSPLVGGFIATEFGPPAAMWVAAIIFAIAAIPLMMTPEPIKTRQKVKWKGFPWRQTWRGFVAESAIGFDLVTVTVVWQLYIATVVLADLDEEVYAALGIFISIGMIAALLAARAYGKLIDNKSGKYLLKYSVLAKSIVNLFRSFVGSPAGVVATNSASEISTTGFSMAFMRGMFDAADRSGHRLAYMYIIEIAVNLGAAICCGVFALLLVASESPEVAMKTHFIVGALAVLLIATPRFPMYRK